MATREGGTQSVSSGELTRETVFEILSNQRRRFTLHYLKHNNRSANGTTTAVPMTDVVDQIASWENGKPIGELTPQERKRVQNALRQFHVPKMVEEGFIEYDAEDDVLRLTEATTKNDFYIDVLSNQGIPWGLYYVGLAGISVVCLLGILLSVAPFTYFTPLTWSVFFVTAFAASALGHYYDNRYRMRLGSRDVPPEVTQQ